MCQWPRDDEKKNAKWNEFCFKQRYRWFRDFDGNGLFIALTHQSKPEADRKFRCVDVKRVHKNAKFSLVLTGLLCCLPVPRTKTHKKINKLRLSNGI